MSSRKVAVVDTRLMPEVPVLQYDWVCSRRRETAIQLYQDLGRARQQGLVKQELKLSEQILQLYERDLGVRTVVEAKQMGFDSKPFAIIPGAMPGRSLSVRGDKWYWELTPVEQVRSPVPPQALRAMAWARSQSFEGYWVASPAPLKAKLPGAAVTRGLVGSTASAAHKTASAIGERLRNLDPVLVVLIGRTGITLELCRWA